MRSHSTGGRASRLLAIAAAAGVVLAGVVVGAPAAQADVLPTPDGTAVSWTGDVNSLTGSAASTTSCDVNGDGFGDAVVGAWTWQKSSYGDVGAAYVLLGDAEADGGELASPSDVGAVRIDGPSRTSASVAFSVSCAGDVNKDGFDDIIIGDWKINSVYVIMGAENFEPLSLDSIGDRGYTVKGPADSNFGYSVARVGDVNGDGFGDIGVGAVVADTQGRNNNGQVWIVGGKSTIGNIDLTDPTNTDAYLTVDGSAASERLSVVSSVGDVNGDGIDDLLFGAYTATSWGSSVNAPGVAYVIWGGQSGNIDAANLGSKGFTVKGPKRQRDRLGVSVAAAGDVNGDGLADLLIGADGVTNATTGPRNGGAAIVYGSASTATVFTDPTATKSVYTCDNGAADAVCADAATARGYWINGAAASDSAGYAVAGLGDVNGDGISDAVIGAYAYDPISPSTGTAMNGAGGAWIVYGDPTRTATLELASLTAEQGFRIDGAVAGDRLGRAVGDVADFDGNGVADVLLGGDNGTTGLTKAGGATVVLLGDLVTKTSVSDQTVEAGGTVAVAATVVTPVAGGDPVSSGTVAFAVDGSAVAGCEAVAVESAGTASCDIAPASFGSYAVSATYSGTEKRAGSDAQATVIATDTTSVELSVEPDSLYVGSSAALTAEVAAAHGGTVNAGTVTFSNNGTAIAGCENLPVLNGAVGCASPVVGEGTHDYLAVYSGDAVLAGSEGTATASASVADASLALSLPGSKRYGTAFTATVRVSSPLELSGTVELRSAGTVIGRGTVVDGTASIAVSARRLLPGTHALTATYVGDEPVTVAAAVRSTPIHKAVSTTSATVAKTVRSTTKAKVIVKVATSGSGVARAGYVTVKDGTKTIKKVVLRSAGNGRVALFLPKLAKGKHSLTIRYAGSGTVLGSSTTATVTVK